MARPKRTGQRLLTEAELEIMNQIWRIGTASVRQTMEGLVAGHRPAYTTVATMLKILENKGFVESRKQFGVLCYTPKVDRRDYEARSARHLVDKVFQGVPSALVNRLLDEAHWKPEEIRALRDRLRKLAGSR